MTLLNIYSLDDIEESNVIASLPNGKHLIGRGGILKVTDKRISRQHAVIQVDADKVTLTSLHINPCFFKAFNGKTLTIIAKGEECELNDGDQFSLLPEDCWFRIKVKHEQVVDTCPNGALNSKRSHESGSERDDLTKKPRMSTNKDTSQVAEPQTSQNDQFELQLNPSQPFLDEVQEDKPNEDTLDSIDQCIQEDDEVNTSTENHHTLETSHVVEHQTLQDDKLQLELNLSQHFVDEVQEDKPDKDTSDSIGQCIQEDGEVNTSTENHHTLETSHVVEHQTSHIVTSETVQDADQLEPLSDIKEEPHSDNVNGNDRENNIVKQPLTDIKQEPQDGEEVKAPVNEDPNVASGSGTRKTRRERCWYKEKCFRKNPNHRDLFSHPGDEDYASDPEDDRPECPYGIACYRKNLDHRREFKHSTRPAPKPSNANFSIYLPQGCPFCPHCNRNNSGGGGGRKPGYESDVED